MTRSGARWRRGNPPAGRRRPVAAAGSRGATETVYRPFRLTETTYASVYLSADGMIGGEPGDRVAASGARSASSSRTRPTTWHDARRLRRARDCASGETNVSARSAGPCPPAFLGHIISWMPCTCGGRTPRAGAVVAGPRAGGALGEEAAAVGAAAALRCSGATCPAWPTRAGDPAAFVASVLAPRAAASSTSADLRAAPGSSSASVPATAGRCVTAQQTRGHARLSPRGAAWVACTVACEYNRSSAASGPPAPRSGRVVRRLQREARRGNRLKRLADSYFG